MDSKNVIESSAVQAISAAVDVKIAEIVHAEDTSSPAQSIAKIPISKDLTPKEQYQQLWTNLKKDTRFVFWALYVMALVFGWGYDSGL
jgi:hypothetical protein